ncbi:MAG: GT4 family glycosyltransferase PelF [Methylococcales bacterium]|nr:GT4 family glycosyltransferase PelF [Methylococcales bacterium]
MGIKTVKPGQADIGLILEGTYPYVRGGVSSWIHQLIQGLPELTFAINFIGDKAESYSTLHYELPENVIDLKNIYLISKNKQIKPKSRIGNEDAFIQVREMYKEFRRNNSSNNSQALGNVLQQIHKFKNLDINDFLYSEQSWAFITEQYEKGTEDSSFLDYFWTVRAMHQPIFSLIDALDNVVDAKVFHTISTGYAGLFGVMLHHLYDKKLILTEHGIYTKERKIDLSQADWINEAEKIFGDTLNSDFSYLRQLWIRFFESLGRTIYEVANPIISISEGNKRRQIIDGAKVDKISVIANGINLDKLKPQRIKRPEQIPLVIGFIGRVVPIKDVRTFIRAMSNVCSALPEVQAWIIGGEDEDPDYALECRDMIASLHLTDHIIYKGFCNVVEILPQLGCMVLSSISEGVPLVILEAFACGIPVVSTDVGACRELIEGGSEEDKALGAAGAVVSIADPEQLAIEMIKLLSDSNYWKQLSSIAEKRADNYFGEQALFTSYRKVYQKALEK